MTPSKFHDAAWRRDVGHDEMQAEFLSFLRERPMAAIPSGSIVDRRVEGELPLVRFGQVVSFVDAAEILTVNFLTTVTLFELKPRIETVFGVIRQAKAMLALAETAIPAELHLCHIVAKANDPKLAELRAQWPHTWAWGVTFDPPKDGAS